MHPGDDDLLEHLPVLLWGSGMDGKRTCFARRWLAFTGRTLEEQLGDGWIHGIHPEDRAAYLRIYRSSIAARRPFESEFRLRRFDGQYRWLHESAEPLPERDGLPPGFNGCCTDITRHRQAEESLRRHLTLSQHARDALLLLDTAGRILDANQAAERLYGYTHNELLALGLRDLRSHETLADVPQQLHQAWTAGILFQTVHRRKDGSTFPVEVSSQSAVIDGREALVSVIRDITTRRQIEERLRSSEARYGLLFENIREAVALHELIRDADGKPCDYRITEVNPAFGSHTGLTRAEVVGYPASTLYCEEAAPFLDRYRHVVESGEPVSFEAYFAPLKRHFSISAFPIGGDRFATVFADITERKRLDEQFRQAQKMEAVGRLAGGVAHDFNNLLTVILGYSDLLLDSVDRHSPLRNALDSVRKAGERAARLTSQLLAFSRRQVLSPEILDLNTIVRDTSKMLQRLIGEDVDLVLDLSPEPGWVKVDSGQLAQVLINLAVNARDAMPHGGKLTIATGREPAGCGDSVFLSVADTGIGMDAETRSHLFEPFFTTKPVGVGTGLGLCTAYGIVKQSGGEIVVQSEPGLGSTFRVLLPPVAPPDEEPAGMEEEAHDWRGDETVLLVEDEESVRDFAAGVLHRLGYTVLSACDGWDALSLCEDYDAPIHLLISDVVMPGASGPQLAESIQDIRPEIRTLFISGYPGEALVHHNAVLDEHNFLQKPFTADSLGRSVRAVLDAE